MNITPCQACDKWVVSTNMRLSAIWDGELVCQSCANEHDRVRDLRMKKAKLQDDLDNNEEYMKGKRTEYRSQIHDINKEISDLGYDVE